MEELEREIVRYLIARRGILISREVLRQLYPGEADGEADLLEWISKHEDELDYAIGQLPLYRVYSGGGDSEELYVFLPRAVTRGKDASKTVEVIGVILRAVYMDKEEELGILQSSLEKLIGNIVYDEFAGWNEFATQGLAWYHAKLAREYKVYDELVDRFDYGRSYIGARYYRVGNVWLAERWHYCNYNRWGNSVGIQKCVEYRYVDGSE